MTRSDQVELVLFADDVIRQGGTDTRDIARAQDATLSRYLRVLIYNLVLLTAELEQVGPALVEYLEQPVTGVRQPSARSRRHVASEGMSE